MFLKPFLLRTFKFCLSLSSYKWVPINETACWTALLFWRQVVWKENRTLDFRIIKYIIWMLVIYQRHYNLYNLYWKDTFLNLFDSQRVRTSIIDNKAGAAVLCCHGKSSSYIPTTKVIRSCGYGYISLKTYTAYHIIKKLSQVPENKYCKSILQKIFIKNLCGVLF